MFYDLAFGILYAVLSGEIVKGYVTCDFESPVDRLCGFYQDNKDNFDWKLGTGDIQTSVTRPLADHTYANRSGNYVYIESSFATGGSGYVSRFMSPTVVGQRSGNQSHLCVTFYYHMHGPPTQFLHMYIRQHTHNIPEYSHWNRTGNFGDIWLKQALTVEVDGGFQVIFEGTMGSRFHGDISLDDISVTEGQCVEDTTAVPTRPSLPSITPLSQFQCDFEYSRLCGFNHDPRNAFSWQWRGNSEQPLKGPLGDHTQGSTLGSYLFVQTNTTSQRQEQRARIVSPMLLKNTVHQCLRFYYFTNGNNIGPLNAYILQNNFTLPIAPNWFINASHGNIWQPGFMDIPPQTSDYQVVFEAIRRKQFDGSIAIDDLRLTNNVCPTVNTSCDFESGIGYFIQDTTDQMNFYLKNKGTPSYYTGPKQDHTFGNTSGHYVYIETSYYRTRGKVARLISPQLLSTTEHPRCLTFWYHMFGADVDSLTVYMTNGTASNRHTVLWSKTGNRGNKWRAAEVHLQSDVDFQVVFEARQGYSYQGDIALDDIKIVGDVCPGEHHFHNFSSITCNFEEAELCYYEQDKSDDMDWVWINPDSWRVRTGPSVDHTTGNELGFYLYVNYGSSYYWPRFDNPDSQARLLSPWARPQKLSSCLEFWYHMYGKDTETLRVFVQTEGSDIPKTPAWTLSDDQGDYWHRATFDISVINARFRIVFEVHTGNTYRDDIAIDDVTFYNSSTCPDFPTQAPPPVTAPPTRNNASCNFDDVYICNYTQVVDDDFDWTRRSGRRYYWWGHYSGPKRDHTLNTNQGYYMNFDCSYRWWLRFDSRAQLSTPYLGSHAEPRCLHFYYFMYGIGVDLLNVYVVQFGYTLKVDPDMLVYGEQGSTWQHGTLNIPATFQPYRVIFEASKGFGYYCDIAIDDITFTAGVCPEVQPTSAPLSAGRCDFESTDDPLCGYTQDHDNSLDMWGYSWPTDDFDWTLHAGNTSTGETGPMIDHTIRNDKGHYMYIESSLPKRPHNNARLISPLIEGSTENICVQFYYHMKGDGIGNLKLIWKAGNTEEKEVIRISGEQGNNWRPQTVELIPFDKQFQLVFEASVGMLPNGDIAIDDINILRQPCSGSVKESECSFDVADDWCGYTQSSQDNENWKWYDVNHPPKDQPASHKSDRSYIYVASPAVPPNTQERIAKLASRTIDGRSSQHCVEFDYFLSQNKSSSKLTIAVAKNDGEDYNVLTLVGNTETEGWKPAKITLSKDDIGEQFQVVFVGVSSDKTEVIKLDNLTISPGACEEVQNSQSAIKQSRNASPVAVFFGILSAFLMIVIVAIAAFWLYRKHKSYLPTMTVKYNVHKDDGNANVKKKISKESSFDNPVYVSDRPTAVMRCGVINEAGTNGVH